MKNSDLIVIGLAAAVLGFVVLKNPRAAAGTGMAATRVAGTPAGGSLTTGYGGYSPLISGVPANSAPLNSVTEISQPDGAAWSNGWRYFSDGTSISPDGVYYQGGNQVFNPAGMYQ